MLNRIYSQRETDIPVCRLLSRVIIELTAKVDFPLLISHFSLAIASVPRLESGLVRLARRDTMALSKRRVENFLDDVK